MGSPIVDSHNSPCLCVVALASTRIDQPSNGDLSLRKKSVGKKPSSTFMGCRFRAVATAYKKQEKVKGFVIVNNLGGQYDDEGFGDVKTQIFNLFTLTAVTTVMNELYETNPTQPRWFNDFVRSNPLTIFFPKLPSTTMASSLSTFHPISSHISKQNQPTTLSSSFISSPSSIPLSSNSIIPLQFRCNHKQSPSATPTPLTIRAMAPPKPAGKAKKVTGMIKLALEAGKATPAPPVGPALGSKGVNIMAFCKDYNARTADKAGYIIPVEITVYDDKSFTFVLKTPPASVLLLKAAGAEKGSKDPQREKVGKVTIDQLRAIAAEKLPDLNCTTIESAMRIIAGTAANMGIDVDPPVLERKVKQLL